MKYSKILIAFVAIFGLSCEITNLDPQDSPNALRSDQFREDLFITSIQRTMAAYFEGTQDFGAELTRQLHMFGPLYNNHFGPTTMDQTWQDVYAGVLIDIKALKAAATPKEAYQHLGIAKILEAYVLMTLVDSFGDVPYKEALLGTENLNPKVTPGAEVYEAARVLLNEGITDLGKVRSAKLTLAPGFDLIYRASNASISATSIGAFDNWIALANTLKIRLFMNYKFTEPIKARDSIIVLSGKNIIDTRAEDFQFSYSTTNANPNSRHPEFGTNYDNGGSDYMSNYFMNLLRTDYPTVDPRTRYYFYRQQTATPTDVNLAQCIGTTPPNHYSASDPYCLLSGGYWGRDHGDSDGIPPDGARRTIWGFYPIGGRFDANGGGGQTQTSGARGAGISPMWQSSFTFFTLAEAALSLGTGADAQALFNQGVAASLNKVMNFGSEIGYTFTATELAQVPSASVVTAFTTAVSNRYNAATTDEQRLAVVIGEFYKATFGNGFEAYNMYRRTGYPANLQPALEPIPGAFVRSFIYPANYVNRNLNATQKPGFGTEVNVFWDNGSKQLD